MIVGSSEYIEAVTKTNSKSHRHEFYYKTVRDANILGVHVEGHRPVELLEVKRPH